MLGIEVGLDDPKSILEIKLNNSEFGNLSNSIKKQYHELDDYLISELKGNDSLIKISKWERYLPYEYQCEIVKERYFDFENALDLLDNINLIEWR